MLFLVPRTKHYAHLSETLRTPSSIWIIKHFILNQIPGTLRSICSSPLVRRFSPLNCLYPWAKIARYPLYELRCVANAASLAQLCCKGCWEGEMGTRGRREGGGLHGSDAVTICQVWNFRYMGHCFWWFIVVLTTGKMLNCGPWFVINYFNIDG